MTQEYWDKRHKTYVVKKNWARKPSIFSMYVLKYFPKSGSLLDIGTGQGGDARYFQSQGYDITATDFSQEALSHAKSNSEGIRYMHLDTAEGLPFENGSFDIVYSHLALHYFDKKTTKEIFKEIHRILKPNGVFATITNTVDDPGLKDGIYAEIEPDFYQTPAGQKKRYFSIDFMKEMTQDLFETILLDSRGKTYHENKTDNLIRYVGKKK